VIAGIIFLAVEVHQNNGALNLQARQERAAVRRNTIARQVDNPALVRAAVNALQGEPLTPEDVYVLDRQIVFTLVAWATIYGDPLMQETWAERKINYPPSFVERDAARTECRPCARQRSVDLKGLRDRGVLPVSCLTCVSHSPRFPMRGTP
jgi:hypothetical protein